MAFNPENVIWKRSESSGSEEVWDDTALVEAYDKAVNEVKETLANNNIGNPSKHMNKKKGGKSKSSAPRQKSSKWHVGDYCQSMFSEDGMFYEAYIQSIDPEHKSCVVHYVGYDNEEEVALSSLQPSLGRKARQAQELEVQQYENGELSYGSGDVHSESSEATSRRKHSQKQQSSVHHKHYKTSPHATQATRFFHTISPPPPSSNSGNYMPMFPPWSLQDHHRPATHYRAAPMPFKFPPFPPPLPIPLEEGIVSDEEALASMLMSWYMSGYHTGYYQAMKNCRSQDSSRKTMCSNCCHGNR